MRDQIPKEELIADLQRVAEELGGSPSTSEYAEHGGYGVSTLSNRFGSWNGAKDAAGLEKNNVGSSGRFYRCPHCGIKYRSTSTDRITCKECGVKFTEWRGRLSYYSTSKVMVKLSNGPVPSGEINLNSVPKDMRHSIHKIKTSGSPSTKDNNGSTTVYFLPGDLREAIRVYIRENKEFLNSQFAKDKQHFLRSNFSDDVYEILVEQWELMGHGNGDI